MTVVLVVEDDEVIRNDLCELLADEGFATATSEHGEEALSWLRNHPQQACVVLLDLMMPVMDGFDFLRIKDGDPSLAPVPVIVVTAAGPLVEKTLRQNHQVHAFLAKPLDLERLFRVLDGCCFSPAGERPRGRWNN
jgi:CheY-like chemotaxis protein